jgi:hypothetical protein
MEELEQPVTQEDNGVSENIPTVTTTETKKVILLELDFYQQLVKYLGSRPAQEAGGLFIALAQAQAHDVTFNQNNK